MEINFIDRPMLNDILTPDRNKNNLHRNFYVVIGNDTVYDHHKMSYNVSTPFFQNPIRWSRPDIANNTGLLIRQTDTVPALNIALEHTFDLGSIDRDENQPGTIVNKSFSLKGVNLVGSVDLSDAEAGNISLPVKSYIPVQ